MGFLDLFRNRPSNLPIVWERGGHTQRIDALCFDRDGRFLASGGADGKILLWDFSQGVVLNQLDVGAKLRSLAFSTDGKLLAAACADDRVRLWEVLQNGSRLVARGEIVGDLQFMGVFCVAFQPRGGLLAFGTGNRQVYVMPVETIQGECKSGATSLYQAPNAVTTIAWSPTGDYLVVGDMSGFVSAVEQRSRQAQRIGRHEGSARSAAYSPDAASFLTGGQDSRVNFWDIKTGHATAWRGHKFAVCSLDYARDTDAVASGSGDHTAIIWSRTGQLLAQVPGGVAVAWSPKLSHHYLATVWNWEMDNCLVRVYDAAPTLK